MTDLLACEYRTAQPDNTGLCQIVADLTDLPLAACAVTDSACEFCLSCGITPQSPNQVTAQFAITCSEKAGHTDRHAIRRRLRPLLLTTATERNRPITCILRGLEVRQVTCKPCQAASMAPVLVSVYRCSRHNECTLHNTGIVPRIHACATCEDRLETGYQLNPRATPEEVLKAIAATK